MKSIKVFIYVLLLLIAICVVMKYVNLEWWHDTMKKTLFVPKKEVVEIYAYKDKKDIIVISDKPVPEDYQGEADKVGRYERGASK
jgi:hypothetical protein